ncbi:MAG: hypothetical protein R3B48_26255 [Kofleriaceae bacterium]
MSVTVSKRGVPDTTVTAVFVDSDGAMVAQGLVGAGGKTEARLPKGGIVHVIEVVDQSDTVRNVTIRSLRDVRPGDKLAFDAPTTRWNYDPTDRTFTGSFTPLTELATYSVDIACGFGTTSSTTVTLYATDSCLPNEALLLMTASGAAVPTPKYSWLTFDRGSNLTRVRRASMGPSMFVDGEVSRGVSSATKNGPLCASKTDPTQVISGWTWMSRGARLVSSA